MIYNILAIFNEVQLVEIETVLHQNTLMTQGDRNQLERAVEDYQYLRSKLTGSNNLHQQVIMFLLDSTSTNPERIEEFITELGVWLKITPSQTVQKIYAHVIKGFQDIVYCFDTNEILALRHSLLSALREIEKDTDEKKAKSKYSRWKSQDLTHTEAPMQFQEGYDEYELMMEVYGKSFESANSLFNSVPNTKEMWNREQPSYELAFDSYYN